MGKREEACGPTWLPGALVPDRLLGLHLTPYCQQHDDLYETGSLHPGWLARYRARRRADLLFVEGIHGESVRALHDDLRAGRWLPLTRYVLRLAVGWLYYAGVRLGGWASYRWRRHG